MLSGRKEKMLIESQSGWVNKTDIFLSERAFPFGIFLLLTGLFWLGDHGLYSKLFYWSLLLPTLLSILLFPGNVRNLLASRICVAYLPFACYMASTVFWSTSDDGLFEMMKRPLFVLLFFYPVFELGRRRFDLLCAAVKWGAVLAVVAAVWTLGEFLFSVDQYRLTGYGALYNPLLTSHVFGFFLAWWLGLYFSERRLFDPVALSSMLILLGLVLATGSRTPLVAMFAVVIWLSVATRNRKGILTLCSLLTGCILVWLFAPEILTQRGLSHRTEIWMDVLRQISEKPWFGHGFNSPLWVRLEALSYPLQDPHNLTLAVFFIGGAVGGILWLVLYATALLESWRWRNDKWVLVFSATLIYGLMAGMTEGGSFLSRPKEHWFLVWIPLALMSAAVYQACIRSRMDTTNQGTTGANG